MTNSAQLTELSGSRIVRRPAPFPKAPNLVDYKGECERFDWADAWKLLDGLPNGKGYNIAHEAVDRHAAGLKSGKAAIRWLGKSGERRELSYGDLAEATNRFANTLVALGVPSPLVEEMELLHFTGIYALDLHEALLAASRAVDIRSVPCLASHGMARTRARGTSSRPEK
jgi:hypothetical protein